MTIITIIVTSIFDILISFSTDIPFNFIFTFTFTFTPTTTNIIIIIDVFTISKTIYVCRLFITHLVSCAFAWFDLLRYCGR